VGWASCDFEGVRGLLLGVSKGFWRSECYLCRHAAFDVGEIYGLLLDGGQRWQRSRWSVRYRFDEKKQVRVFGMVASW